MFFALYYEGLADFQLQRYKEKYEKGEIKSKICDYGLFRYSRHPNYFGEILFWWGIYFACNSTNHLHGYPVGAVIVTLMFLFGSAPWMDRHL